MIHLIGLFGLIIGLIIVLYTMFEAYSYRRILDYSQFKSNKEIKGDFDAYVLKSRAIHIALLTMVVVYVCSLLLLLYVTWNI